MIWKEQQHNTAPQLIDLTDSEVEEGLARILAMDEEALLTLRTMAQSSQRMMAEVLQVSPVL